MLYIDFLKKSITKEILLLQNKIFFDKKPNLNFSIENTPNRSFGEVSTNVALINAKNININPLEFALKIKEGLEIKKEIKLIDIVKPGFINITLRKEYWHQQLKLLASKSLESFYASKELKKFNLEYVSANPTGLMHIGHARGAVLGDVLASILECVGHNVTREYYINDAGNQILSLMNTIYHYFPKDSKCFKEKKNDIDIYPGEYLKSITKKILKKYDVQDIDKSKDEIKIQVLLNIMNDIKLDLENMDIKHDNYVSEKELIVEKDITNFITFLKKNDLAYIGYQDPPKGVNNKNWKKQQQLLFKSKRLGDDSDRALMKKNGEITYFMSDIIYHQDKVKRNFDVLLNIWGADHHGYVARIKNAVKSVAKKEIHFEVLLTALVNLIKNKKPVKMSKRMGDYVTLREVLEEVGKDAIRFMMISRSHDKIIDFDFDVIKQKSKDNQVYYVKYAHARCASIKRNTKKLFTTNNYDISQLQLDVEIDLIKKLANYSIIIRQCAENLEPHRLTNYLYELSKKFHNYWSLGNIDSKKKIVVTNNDSLSVARTTLVSIVQKILKDGLDILKIDAPEEM